MNAFSKLLHANAEVLLQAIYRISGKQSYKLFGRARVLAASLGFNEEQLICGLGFNPNVHEYTDIISSLGYNDYAALQTRRNEVFCSDVYERLSLDNVLTIYYVVKAAATQLQEMQALTLARITAIETALETNIRPRLMQFHRSEVETIYRDGIAGIEFAEARLTRPDNGFRSMLNEVLLIVNAKLIPAGDLFFRESVLPQERRRLYEKGLIPKSLIAARLRDMTLSTEERSVLESCLAGSWDTTLD